jgi:hypothetical protein
MRGRSHVVARRDASLVDERGHVRARTLHLEKGVCGLGWGRFASRRCAMELMVTAWVVLGVSIAIGVLVGGGMVAREWYVERRHARGH